MDLLLDLNIIIDLLIPARRGYLLAKQISEIIEKNKYSKWIAASSIDNLEYTLLSEAKRFNLQYADKIRLVIIKFLSETKIISVTGASIREAIHSKDLEDHIIYNNFKRIASDGIVISSDKYFKKYPDVISPQDFINNHEKLLKFKSTISMLDLKKEYRFMIEEIENSIFESIAKAKYVLGPEVKQLEDKIAEYTDVKHCVGISSGTDALVLSLRAHAIKIKKQEYWEKDDLIITTPFTFTATGDAILRSGATPVFIDIDSHTHNIDHVKIKEYLSTSLSKAENQRSKVVGILPVHLYGQSCNMDEIMKIAKEYNLFVIEDTAQAFGGEYKRKKLGSVGTAGVYSFFPSKNLGGFGDGGMVATNDGEIAEITRMLLRHGGKDKYNVEHIGYNARLDTLQAAIVLEKFKYIDDFNCKRRERAEVYFRELKDVSDIVLPPFEEGHVFHQFTVRASHGARDKLKAYLNDHGISSMVYYPVPLHKMKVFEGRSRSDGALTESEKAANEVLSLPISPLISEEEVKAVADKIKGFYAV